jgi:Histidine kinase-, DNA gyrase B-, and HSP90-like ATPase
MNKNFIANLRVDKRIVDLLSKSTYQKSFASTIRELVSNSYDADALSVSIILSDDYKSISIEDDGNGMSEFEFVNYLTIAGTKTSSELTRRYKRKRIGQFGIGFLAVFPFCETLEIITSSENSDEVLTAEIPAIDYSKVSENQSLDNIQIPCQIIEDKSQRLRHYTKITLINPTYNVFQYFSKIETRKRESISTYDPYEKFIWELQEDLPISYNPDDNSFPRLIYNEPIGINVNVNGKPLFRNELQRIVLEKDSAEIAGIECEFIFTTSYRSIRPLEARGIKMRVNNVGIGVRTDFQLKRDRGFSRLHWISGEIHYSEKMKEHLTISRDSFILNTVIDEIHEYFAEKLRKWAYYVEDVGIAEKAINQSMQNSKKGNVTPKEEIITNNLKKLSEKGFKIVHKEPDGENANTKKQISFDNEEKIVTVFNKPELKKDYIYVNGKNFEIIYSSTDFSETDPPCKLIKSNLIELNQNYPLFKSKTYGNLFKMLHIFLTIAKKENNTSEEMYQFIVDNFKKEFEQFK